MRFFANHFPVIAIILIGASIVFRADRIYTEVRFVSFLNFWSRFMNVWPLPRITFRELSTIRESRRTALITEPAVWATLKGHVELPVGIQAEPNRRDRDFFESLGETLPASIEVVYGIGGELVIDAAKMVSYWSKKPLVVIPTAFSSDTIFSPMAEVREGKIVKDTVTGPAEEVIIDWDVIGEAPLATRGAMIVDVMSIMTALLDWRYAAQKNHTTPETRLVPWAVSVAAGLAAQAIKIAPAVGSGAIDALRTLLDLTCLTVQLNNQLGHDRVSHGTEHIFAQIVKADPDVTHTERVAAGILYAAALNGQDSTPLRTALEAAGVRLDLLRESDIRAAATGLADYVREHDLPYSFAAEQTDNQAVNAALAKSTLLTATVKGANSQG